ncbi:MAG: hypothetical protein R3A44_22275 [Caldilineaceae bacterium]
MDHIPLPPADDAEKQQQVRQRYGIGERPFVLGLSTQQPQKLCRLIDAFTWPGKRLIYPTGSSSAAAKAGSTTRFLPKCSSST